MRDGSLKKGSKWKRALKLIFAGAAMNAMLPVVPGNTDFLAPAADILLRNHNNSGVLFSTTGFASEIAAIQYRAPGVVAAYYTGLKNAFNTQCSGGVKNCQSGETLLQRMDELYDGYGTDPLYSAWDGRHNEMFKEAIASDLLLVRARKNWEVREGDAGYMSLQERGEAVQRLLDLHAQAYSEGPLEVKPAQVRIIGGFKDGDDLKKIRMQTYSEYSFSDMSVSFGQALLEKQSFELMAESATHEARHHLQGVLIKGLKEPVQRAWLEKEGLLPHARIMEASLRMPQADGYTAYRKRPYEVNARAKEGAGREAGDLVNRSNKTDKLKTDRPARSISLSDRSRTL